ncbi:MFS transporter [Aestuariimicrobium kwangyangense]|uniref:MFS transporter n=1 Tax=Aestuariimicrobium kwangyangense TaxID=396389 RepID=UPI0003B78C22|nr:MFS transporter [Aestuariimicrobium kwangyangense]
MTGTTALQEQAAVEPVDPAFGANQWRLALAQLLSGVGIASGVAVGAVLVEETSGSTQLAGFAQTATVIGAGLLAFPLSRLARLRGRRVALGLGFGLGALGAVLILTGVQIGQPVLLFLGLTLFGSATASGLQSRYAATDLAPEHMRARAMSVVVWATTVGSVAGPQLSAPGAALGRALGLNHLVGPYLFSVTAFVLAALVTVSMRKPQRPLHQPGVHRNVSMKECLLVAWRHPVVLLGMVAVITGQMMMTVVMVMTPLHMYHHAMGLEIVGIVISSHILGMYGLSPLVGWLVDRWGAQRVIVLGMGIFLVAFAVGILDALGQSHLVRLIPALTLLGIGWSCTLIAGSTLVAQTVEPELKVPMQGTVDTFMNFGAAAITASAGTVLAWQGFVGINLLATCVLVLLVVVAVRAKRVPVAVH